MLDISRNTEAILLLCCRLPREFDTGDDLRPLTHTEYIKLAALLHKQGYVPADLLDKVKITEIAGIDTLAIDSLRLSKLMTRGLSLSLAREKWSRFGVWIMSRADREYPQTWKKKLKNRAPALLYGVGDWTTLDDGGLGVVGSRDISEKVAEFVREVGKKSAIDNIRIVSGGARGVDTIATDSALDAGGAALSVLADSLAKMAVAKKYRAPIQEGRLTLVSPFSPDAGFNAGNAMSRNKMVYSSCDFVLIAQTEIEKGGTWAGAMECLSHNWVPLLVQSRFPSEGLTELRKMGAQSFDIPDNNSFANYLTRFAREEIVEPKQTSFLS